MEGHFKIAVIGLGIIGGSVAYALKGFKDADITGYDRDKSVCKKAVSVGAICKAAESDSDAICQADLVVIATYPDSIVDIIDRNRNSFKNGAVVCDLCGVKTSLANEIRAVLPNGVDYVGGHPMAGKEVDGFKNAEADLFNECGFIITPTEESKKESIDLVYEMAEYIGARRIAINNPEKHDEIIAYTSDLMHIAAAGLVLNYNEDMNLAYTAGAFRDCTRIALINPTLWTELFMTNADNTVAEIDRFIGSLTKLKDAIVRRDEKTLFDLLSTVRTNKEKILKMEPKDKERGCNDENA